jgi:hypothetical protein
MEIAILTTILGYLIGILWERWKYYKKTGRHLQDL